MRINLNNTNEFTLENVQKLIGSEDGTINVQVRVTKDGILYLSKDVGNQNLNDILFRLETFGAGNGYVGKEASEDEEWVNTLFKIIKENWENPGRSYIDT